jgi:hypothetical protein
MKTSELIERRDANNNRPLTDAEKKWSAIPIAGGSLWNWGWAEVTLGQAIHYGVAVPANILYWEPDCEMFFMCGESEPMGLYEASDRAVANKTELEELAKWVPYDMLHGDRYMFKHGNGLLGRLRSDGHKEAIGVVIVSDFYKSDVAGIARCLEGSVFYAQPGIWGVDYSQYKGEDWIILHENFFYGTDTDCCMSDWYEIDQQLLPEDILKNVRVGLYCSDFQRGISKAFQSVCFPNYDLQPDVDQTGYILIPPVRQLWEDANARKNTFTGGLEITGITTLGNDEELISEMDN